jgi:hypothetical protein
MSMGRGADDPRNVSREAHWVLPTTIVALDFGFPMQLNFLCKARLQSRASQTRIGSSQLQVGNLPGNSQIYATPQRSNPMSKKRRTHGAKEPPLERCERVETDPTTGSEIRVVSEKRGVLGWETRHYSSPQVALDEWSATVPVKEELEGFCEHLRDQLEKRGLPSDRTPSWIKMDNGEWKPDRPEGIDRESRMKHARARWSHRLKELTEPLSKNRAAGNLLDALVEVLKRPGIDEHLWHVVRLMNAYRVYCITGNINNLATMGFKARKGRSDGPLARHRSGKETRQVICDQAKQFWSAHPLYRNDATNTAEQIAATVNAELLARKLLSRGKTKLCDKTIGDHIRAGIRGKML